jgi:hypothetical protein
MRCWEIEWESEWTIYVILSSVTVCIEQSAVMQQLGPSSVAQTLQAFLHATNRDYPSRFKYSISTQWLPHTALSAVLSMCDHSKHSYQSYTRGTQK